MNIKTRLAATCMAVAAAVSAFDAALTDPIAWLYADSKIATAERLDEIDVPANGVVDVNILVNGLKPGERLEFDAFEKGGEWYRMRAVPVARNTGVNGFLEKNPGNNPHVARRAPFEVFDVLEPLANACDAARSANAPMRSFAASRAGSRTTRRRASSTAKSAATFSGPLKQGARRMSETLFRTAPRCDILSP